MSVQRINKTAKASRLRRKLIALKARRLKGYLTLDEMLFGVTPMDVDSEINWGQDVGEEKV